MRRKIFAVAALLWMIVIFSFSAKVAEDSEEMSRSVGMLIGKAVIKEYKEWPGKRQAAFAAKIDYPVRKAAHASEYALLGILLTGAIMDIRKPWKRQLLACFLIGAAYAASDEFHQLFVPGRSGQIDQSGTVLHGSRIGQVVIIINNFLVFLIFHKYITSGSLQKI